MENINLESQMFKIFELDAELKRGAEQYAAAIPQYEALLDIVKTSERANELPEGFCEHTTEDLENIKKGLHNIKKRLMYIQMLKDKVKDNSEAEGLVTLVFLALGIGVETGEQEAH